MIGMLIVKIEKSRCIENYIWKNNGKHLFMTMKNGKATRLYSIFFFLEVVMWWLIPG